ncbi:uncharacterized protein N7483_006171 [Penicillium malachiteum]|uniref:uncharacterized protein n=1 Tax=Penicillium malachiteum TaxID=1324776 RepID=UPI00254953EF|nr:uncharacterized protein N7483_006171 [Penicillium malachiteum]KAJ5731663.1 hypothetical protein N7483_006171 [Penicillium malachiteum]
MTQSRNQVIYAASGEAARNKKSIFLAGSISHDDSHNWRNVLTTSLSDLSITIYNPHRPDWDSSWDEDIEYTPFREQVEWELEKQEVADIIVVYFHPATKAPISLLELGLCARVPGKALVVCPPGYWKRGNVQVVCKRFGMQMVESNDELKRVLAVKLGLSASCNVAQD